ncbi:MAG: SDR family oxidoreductase [Candidatus Latescibacteria bacterium]|nr:SDR family oxidoreductase [bacterium]MCB9517234.1 SDR family oxidoreductase [Candidatus Latescibacterota bacterium]
MELAGKRILVTGGAVRVGRAIALELAAAGAALLCHYHRSEDAARDLAATLDSRGQSVNLLREDLAAPGGAERLAAAAGPVDALVNSAAVFLPGRLGGVTEADWDLQLSLNLKSVFFLSQALGTAMRERGGAIVNIADVAGQRPWPRYLAYSASKAGVIALTQGLARALAPAVRVNAVAPGPVMLPADYDDAQRDEALRGTLLGREGSAGNVAHAVRFLLENDYVTGVVLPVDGGRALK